MESNCLDEMLSSFLNCFLLDKLWWKDYGIPLIGMVGIPLVVWILTRYYGADKAEERKELRQLRDNLTFLKAIIRENTEKCLALRERTAAVVGIESRQEGFVVQQELELIFSSLIVTDYFEIVDIEKYASCSRYDPQFISNLILLKNIIQMLHLKIEIRNSKMKSVGSIDELTKDIPGSINILRHDCTENEEFYQEINNVILKSKNLISEIQLIEKGLGVSETDLQQFTNNDVQLFEKIEQEYTTYIKYKGNI